MRALLLAGGLGTRLRPLTDTIPKCLVPIRGRPLLDYWLDLLLAGNTVERVLINTHHLAEQVRAHVRSSRWAARVDLVHEDTLLGTAGTLAVNADYFGEAPALVAHADNLTDLQVTEFTEAYAARPQRCHIAMLTFRCDDPRSCGIVELDAEDVVVGFHEKATCPPSNLANAAIYIMGPEIRRFIIAEHTRVVDISTQLIPTFLGQIFAVEHRGYLRDIGTIDALSLAQHEFPTFQRFVNC